jgi:hypothetical protein
MKEFMVIQKWFALHIQHFRVLLATALQLLNSFYRHFPSLHATFPVILFDIR